MTDVRPSRALFNSALFAVAAFLSFSLAFLACRGENPGRERERLQKEIEMARDSISFWGSQVNEAFRLDRLECSKDIPKTGRVLENLKKQSEACKGISTPHSDNVSAKIRHFTHIRDSLHRRLKELPPPK